MSRSVRAEACSCVQIRHIAAFCCPGPACCSRWQVCRLTSICESQVDALKSRSVCACSPAVLLFLLHVPAGEAPAMCIALARPHLQGRQLAKHSRLSGLQQGCRASHTSAICHVAAAKLDLHVRPRLTHTADCQNFIVGILRYDVAAAQWKGSCMQNML